MKGLPLRRTLAWAGAFALASAFPALAGVPLRTAEGLPMRWEFGVGQPNVVDGRITYFVDPAGSVEEPPGDTTERDAVAAAFAAWEGAPGSRLRFREDASRQAWDRDGSDRVNYLGWKRYVLGPFTLAATYTTSSDGVITDSDILFNDNFKYVKWATTTPGLEGYADVQSVATHEIGHLAGLDHSPVMTSTMSWLQPVGAIASRTLAPDDVGAILEAYPNVSDPSVGSIIGSVRMGRRRAPRGTPVFALDARTGEPAGSAFTGADGYYRIHGLPPGPYFVAATPLASATPYSRWWAGAPDSLLATLRVETLPDGGTPPEVVLVRPGFPEVGRDIAVRRLTARLGGEPDDGPEDAREVAPGGFAGGAFEDPVDEDWFRFEADGTNSVDVRVRSWSLGAEADPEIAVLAADGQTVLAASLDVRASVDPANSRGPAGVDRDCAVVAFSPPTAGEYFVRVRAQPQSTSGRPASFYLLHLVPSADVPDARRTTASVHPPSTRAGAGVPATLRVVPRNGWGDPIAAGVSITAERSDGGPGIDLAAAGDGSWTATVPVPDVPGPVVFTLLIGTMAGRATVPSAATLEVAGPVDAARSTLTASPLRVEADGLAAATLVFVPRDAAGRLLGPGLDAALVFEGVPAGALGPLADMGDGTYVAVLTAPAAAGSARVAAVLDGAPAGPTRLVGFGWDLTLVASDLGAEVDGAQGLPGISRREMRGFGRTARDLDALASALAAGDDPGAAAAAAAAVAGLLRAGRSPRYPEGVPFARDLAEALRRRAHALIDGFVLPSPDPAGERILGTARALLARADTAAAEADPARASRLAALAVARVGTIR